MNTNLKILHIIPLIGCGGAEILLGDIVEKQVELGHNVIICCLHPFHPTFENYVKKTFLLEKIQIVFLQTRVQFSLKGKTKIIGKDYKKLINQFKPNIIHSHLFEAELIAMSYLREGITYISHIHDNISQFQKFRIKDVYNKKRLATLKERNWLFKRYSLANTQFISISSDVSNYLNENLPLSIKNRISFLPNGIDIERFIFLKSRKLDPINIVSVGNLVKKKNHQLLLRIAVLLKENGYNDFQINILGFGPLFDELNRKIAELELQDYVFLRGSVGNVDQFYKNANIYIHTATYEPFGLVLVEAMASGLPLIALDGKGNRDLFEGKNNGFLILKNDPKLFVDKIKLLINDVELYSTISNNCIEFSKQFGIDSYVDKLTSIYRSIMEQSVV